MSDPHDFNQQQYYLLNVGAMIRSFAGAHYARDIHGRLAWEQWLALADAIDGRAQIIKGNATLPPAGDPSV